MEEQEYGKCEICGKEAPLERTYFYYPIHCECCGNKDKDGQKRHFEMVRHCKDCPAPIPAAIYPMCKSLDVVDRPAYVVNMLPVDIIGKFIIDKRIINHFVIRED